MATLAAYRHVELDRIGMGKKRVLKPPGGGSSISFGEEEEAPKVTKPCPAPTTPTPEAAKENVPSATESDFPTPVDTKATEPEQNPPTTNGMNGTNDTKSINSPPSTPSSNNPSTPNTPNSIKDPDTKSRLFGDDTTNLPPRPVTNTPTRLDRMKSTIFVEESPKPVTNGTTPPATTRNWGRRRPHSVRNPITGEGVYYWDLHPPRSLHIRRKPNSAPVQRQSSTESAAPEKPVLEAPPPRGRIPPGGFSTKLW